MLLPVCKNIVQSINLNLLIFSMKNNYDYFVIDTVTVRKELEET